MNDPVRVRHADTGGEAVVQRASLRVHAKNGWVAHDPGAIPPPLRGDRKDRWVDHAVDLGLDRDQAETLTKDDLIALTDPSETSGNDTEES